MGPTRDFRETIVARAQRDAKFRQALFTESLNAYLAGDSASGKAILRDLINATIGFEATVLRQIEQWQCMNGTGESDSSVKRTARQ